ncbi:MAG: hydrolase or metal-binding protein [Polaromonas sp.]|uniref:recombination directionality factor n=1 Tax=Polaromonas sp. TaxID=1869339 RepID=UPI002486F1CC|nr:hydrolase or metal-binding protein [Polaromonas sp.]MDI1269488.1 hydrolase or metal-binding protein [Polaromonas sp.]
MLKGLALTPPVVGRISIGKVVERDGRRLPEKDDEFTVTSQVQNPDGWVNHPVDQTLRKAPDAKLRCIPVRLLFNDPDLNLRANYSMFDRKTGRPLCVGNGETCRRVTSKGMETLPCFSPDGCELAVGGNCKPCGRLNVRIGDEDELGSFIFRTTGYNSIRTLSTRLKYFHAVSGGLLSTLPLELRLRGKSTTQSHRAPIYYVDLTVRTGMTLAEAIAGARAEDGHRKGAGFDQAALEDAARQGFANGAFEESEEEGVDLMEEFYPDEWGNSQQGNSMERRKKPDLVEKLHNKVANLNGAEGTATAF